MFLHAGWFHVGANMVTLWIFGDNVEDRLGHLKFLLFYLACGVVAGLSHTYLNAASTLPTVGASGAIAGVLGGYLLLYPRGRVVTIIPLFYFLHVVELPAIVYLGFWFISQVFSGLLALGAPAYQAGVAWWAHLGGFVAGLLLVLPMRGRPLPRRYTRDFEW
jgi:membrane associated rhomboid family serine protease